MGKRTDLTGQIFNYLTVLNKSGITRPRTYYECICKCGNKVTVEGSKLKNGHTKSCGCWKLDHKHTYYYGLPDGESLKNRIFSNYKYNAKNKNQEFALEKEYFMELLFKNCFYCGRAPFLLLQHNKSRGEVIYNGIDRKNNDIGYLKDNCVTCCFECNARKSSIDFEKFIQWIKMCYENLFKD